MISVFPLLKPSVSIPIIFSFLLYFLASKDAIGQACEPSDFVVAIDIGHTLSAPGAISARGVTEFEFNRELSTEVVAALKKDGFFNSFLINDDGRIASLIQRTRNAAEGNADLFLSIHHDSVQPHYLNVWVYNGQPNLYSDLFSGYSIFVSSKNPKFNQSHRAAVELGIAFRARGLKPTLHHAEPIPGEDRPLLNPNLGIYRFDDLVVLKRTSIPAVLLEAGVIVNRNDEVMLAEPAHQQLIASSIVDAIRTFCHQGNVSEGLSDDSLK